MSRKSTLSPESAAVIRHLKAHGRSTVAALRPHFTAMSRAQLVRRLDSLVTLGWLEFGWTEAGDKTWCIRSSARAIPVHTTEPEEVPEPLPVALPRRINVMVGTYVPARGPALRPGSLDFRACPSVGYRC